MKQNFVTLAGPGEAYLEMKKSQFYAACAPVTSESEARAFLEERRKLRPTANHHVFAWLIGSSRGEQRFQRYSDDGEPQGTAGLPVFNVLDRGGIEDAVIVVTRIFGGTLLGTGGLVHCYGHAASAAVEAAGLAAYRLHECFTVLLSYPHYYSFQSYLQDAPVRLLNVDFGVDVELRLALEPEHVEAFMFHLQEASRGEAIIENGDPEYFSVLINANDAEDGAGEDAGN